MIDIRGTMKYDEVGKIFKIVGGCLVERYFLAFVYYVGRAVMGGY